MDEEKNKATDVIDGSAEIDRARLQMLIREIKDNQNLALGIIGGTVAAGIGAAVWAIVTAVTSFQIGWMAIGVGFLVGIAVRLLGKGLDKIFGIAGAVLSLIGCLAGNLLAVCIVLTRQEQIPLSSLLANLNPYIAVELLKTTFSPMDIFFYGIAVYAGYKFSFRRISQNEVAKSAR